MSFRSQRPEITVGSASENEDAITIDDRPVAKAKPQHSRTRRHSSKRESNSAARTLMRPRDNSKTKHGKILLVPGRGQRIRSGSDSVALGEVGASSGDNNVAFDPKLTRMISKASSDAGVRSTASRSSISGSSSVDSHASGGSSQDTEEDVLFPLVTKHVKVGEVDVDEIEEYVLEERLQNEFISKREKQLIQDETPTPAPQFGSAVSSTATRTNSLSSNRQHEVVLPDRFSFFNSVREETVHAPDFSHLIPEGGHVIDMFEPEDSVWWLDCTCPTDDEMKMMSKAFGIHPLTAEDIRTQEPREKVEMFRTYYFVSFHTFEDDQESEDFLERINVYIVVFRQGILTFHFSPINNPANVRRRVRQLRDYVCVSSDWLCYAMIDDITDDFMPVINSIEFETDAIEDAMFVLRQEDFRQMLYKIGEVRRKVMTLMRLLQGKADVIKMFAKRCQDTDRGPSITSSQPVKPRADISLYLGDIQDHLLTMFQSLLSYEKILSRAHANYLSLLQVESFYFNNDVMDMLGKVTFLGTILVPMNLVTGLFGMNVLVPGKDGGNYGWFGGIIGFIVFVCVITSLCGEYYMSRLGKEDVSSSESVQGYNFGKRQSEYGGRDEDRSMNSLPTKFSRYWN